MFDFLLYRKHGLFLFILIFLIAGNSLKAQKKPNMIVFISDDQSQMDLGCYGNPDVKTPHMDQLAAEGMRFTSAYSATSMCAPSRSSMFSGLYPFRNGSQMNHFAVRPNIKMLPDYLKKLGYRVVIAGKVDVYPKPDFEHIGAYFGNYLPISNRNDPRHVTRDFIKDNFPNSEQPICLIVCTWLPHVPWFENKKYDSGKLTMPKYLVDPQATREALAAYYESISAADGMLGEVLQALDDSGEKNNTVFMFTSDQGPQFPSAKWTTYKQGLNVPFIVRWPKKIKKNSVSDALISLTDLTPTLVDFAGGEEVTDLDGKSFKSVLLGDKKEHRDVAFAETSVEPHFWYNYVPSRTVITKEGLHYIKNYYPGVRFITHIDKVEQDHFYFDSWKEKAKTDAEAEKLLHRYSYRPPEELYDLKQDTWEMSNLINDDQYVAEAMKLGQLLTDELSKQGESETMILKGNLPTFDDGSYQIDQGISASDQSFDKTKWNPSTLFITAYLEGADQEGIICDYFGRFNIYSSHHKLGIALANGKTYESEELTSKEGHLFLKLTEKGDLSLRYNDQEIISVALDKDFTKIKPGYISCGMIRDRKLPSDQPNIFPGKIYDLRVSVNELERSAMRK